VLDDIVVGNSGTLVGAERVVLVRISSLDYHKMGRRDLIENAEQGVFDVASGI
jgi:hypothetical protein